MTVLNFIVGSFLEKLLLKPFYIFDVTFKNCFYVISNYTISAQFNICNSFKRKKHTFLLFCITL